MRCVAALLSTTTVSLQIANRMSPRELVETIERGDIDHLCAATDITRDRALKVVAKLRDSSITEILATRVEDDNLQPSNFALIWS